MQNWTKQQNWEFQAISPERVIFFLRAILNFFLAQEQHLWPAGGVRVVAFQTLASHIWALKSILKAVSNTWHEWHFWPPLISAKSHFLSSSCVKVRGLAQVKLCTGAKAMADTNSNPLFLSVKLSAWLGQGRSIQKMRISRAGLQAANS